MSGERPTSVVVALHALADWLDEADRLIDRLAAARGIERRNSGDETQQDLRALADWFGGHPALAAEAWAHVTDETPAGVGVGVVPAGGDELREMARRAVHAEICDHLPDGGPDCDDVIGTVLDVAEVRQLCADAALGRRAREVLAERDPHLLAVVEGREA